MKPTIYDVAKEANVSIATVSNVINNRGKISEKTKKRVLAAIKYLNYEPSVVASALTGKNTYTIGLLLHDIANPFFSELARSIEDHSTRYGFNVIICSTDNNEEKEKKYIDLLIRKRVDGVLLASGFKKKELIHQLMEQDIPVAIIAQEIPSMTISTVAVDDFRGGYIAASHLLQLGHKKIAVIGDYARSSEQRINGVIEAMASYHLSLKKEYIKRNDASTANGKEATKELLCLRDRPTAIFAFNDLVAVGVIQCARELNIRIPDELSVVGFDNTILATNVEPPLTTVAQPTYELGREVIKLLRKEIKDNKAAIKQKKLFMPELIIRKTTKKLVKH